MSPTLWDVSATEYEFHSKEITEILSPGDLQLSGRWQEGIPRTFVENVTEQEI